jgi:hypothetical protein
LPAAASRAFVYLLLGAFYISTLALPAAPMNKVLFGSLLVVALLTAVVRRGALVVHTGAPVAVLAIFAYGYCVALASDVDMELSRQFMLSVSVLGLIYLVRWYDIDVEALTKVSGLLLTVATGCFVVLVLLFPSSAISTSALSYFLEYGLGVAGERELSGSQAFMFHFGAVPYLFLPFVLFVRDFAARRCAASLGAALAVSVPIAISSSRGLLLACVAGALVVIMARLGARARLLASSVAAIALGSVIAYLVTYTTLFSASDPSNSVKIGHAESFVAHWDWHGALFGDGLAAYYFSAGRNALVAHTEITPLDMLRYFGLPLTVMLYLVLFVPSVAAARTMAREWPYVAVFAIYVLLSCTNPVLFNSYGLLVVVWYWSRVLPGRQVPSPRVVVRAGT